MRCHFERVLWDEYEKDDAQEIFDDIEARLFELSEDEAFLDIPFETLIAQLTEDDELDEDDRFDAIAAHAFLWRPVPAEFGVDGYVCRYESHIVYWRVPADGRIGIVTVLHARMHQIARFRDDFMGGA